MAVIYKAVDTALGRTVAIKVLRPSLTTDPTFLTRFRNEARSVANLSHPNIVTVHDVGADGPTNYIVMELVEGTDLKRIIREKGALPVELTLNIALQICAGAGFAHRAGLVHADIKPQNILLTQKEVAKITDFGIAQAITDTQPQQRAQVVWGSPHYFAPEQARGERPTPASDVYAIGIVLFEMLTGRLPYVGNNQQELALAHIRETIPKASDYNPSIPESLALILQKTMSKEPNARYRMADQLGHVLQAFQQQQSSDKVYPPTIRQSTDSRPIPPPTTPRYPSSEDPPTRHQSAPGFGDFKPTRPREGSEPQTDTSSKPDFIIPVLSGLGRIFDRSKKHPTSEDKPTEPQQTDFSSRAQPESPPLAPPQPVMPTTAHSGDNRKANHDIFISYSRTDMDFAVKIYHDLQAHGLRVWMDREELQPGTPSWSSAIEQAIESCACVIALMSPDAKESRWVRSELSYADEHRRPVLPVLARGDTTNAIPLMFMTAQWVDLREPQHYSTNLTALVDALNVRIGRKSSLEKAGALTFQVYYPNILVPNSWQTLRLYIFQQEGLAAVLADVQQNDYVPVQAGSANKSPQRIQPQGVVIDIEMPQIPGVQITPHEVRLGFYRTWHRLDFDVRALTGQGNISGTISASVSGIAVSALPFHISVDSLAEDALGTTSSVVRQGFQSVFACYSSEDRSIAAQFESAYRTLGYEFFSGYTTTYMAVSEGEDYQAIEQADVFQLFWSHAAQRSVNVEQKWRFALRLIENGLKPRDFIQPVYWQQPAPPIPPELRHLAFEYRPDLK